MFPLINTMFRLQHTMLSISFILTINEALTPPACSIMADAPLSMPFHAVFSFVLFFIFFVCL